MLNKKVLFVLKVPPPFGGGEIEQHYIYDALKNRYRFLLFSRKSHNKAKQGRILISNLLFGVYMIGMVVFACIKYRPRIVFTWLPKDLPAFIRTAILLHILRAMHIKVIGDLHGMGFHFVNKPGTQRFCSKTLNGFYALRILSPGIAKTVSSLGYKRHISVIDNGIKAPKFILEQTPSPPQGFIHLLYLGAISSAKGFARVLDITRALSRTNEHFRIKVVGEWVNDNFKEQSLAFLREQKLSLFFDFVGIQIGEEKWKAIQNSHFLLHLTEMDGQPLTIIESMAAGVPTIATSVGAIPEMITHGRNGLLVDDDREVLDFLQAFYDQKNDYSMMSAAARQTYLERFSLDRYIEEIETLVTENHYEASYSVSENG